MKPNFQKYNNPDAEDIGIKLNKILSNLNLDNIKYRRLEGITDITPHTEQIVKHGLDPRPWLVIPLKGNVYIHNYSNDDVDVRSAQSEVPYELLALG